MRPIISKQTVLLYGLVLTPTLTELLLEGRLPSTLREFLATLCLSAIIAILVQRLRKEYSRVIHLSETDTLTGLCNRYRFLSDLDREVSRAQRLGTSLLLAYIDVDNFKSINDAFGHDEGDRVLKTIGKLIINSTRRNVDSCYRIGGDEFVIIMPSTISPDTEAVLGRIKYLGGHRLSALKTNGSGLSIGIAELLKDEQPGDLLTRADKRMYQEKKKNAEKEKTVRMIELVQSSGK